MNLKQDTIYTYDDEYLIRSFKIDNGDKVLDIGGGGTPFRRADVVVDLYFNDNSHRGGRNIVLLAGKQYIQADIEALPFKDKVFGFALCRHVLEHVDNPYRACSELIRVAKKGFIETPSPVGEYLHGYPTHRWMVSKENDIVVFEKRPFFRNPSHNSTRFLYHKYPPFRDFFEKDGRQIFCSQFFWEDKFNFKVKNGEDDIPNYDDKLEMAVAHLDYALNHICFDEDFYLKDEIMENLNAALQILHSNKFIEKMIDIYKNRISYAKDEYFTLVGAIKKADIKLLLKSMSNDAVKTNWFFSELMKKVCKKEMPINNTLNRKGCKSVFITVVVRTYNREKLLYTCLNSLNNQCFKDFEVVLVNDGGRDVSDVIKYFKGKLVITYINHGTNLGRAASLNSAMSVARGRYLTFLDDDDIYYPDHLNVLSEAVQNNGIKVAYTACKRILCLQKNGKIVPQKEDRIFKEFDRKYLMVVNYIPILTVIIDISLLRETGAFDESMDTNEDWDMLIRLSNRYSFKCIDEVTAEYRQILGSSCSLTIRDSFIDTLREIYARYPSEDEQIRLNRNAFLNEMYGTVMQSSENQKR